MGTAYPAGRISVSKYPIKSFYIFFSANGGETRLFPSGAADHSGKKAGFLPGAAIGNLWLGT
ncbi:Uncharacterized protein dnm_097290 [Desulfonema magnum]|uniref:Uncharacterized protein n=1 Tax=Desulfonema magnum TaxID=45655 RepID=A0A975BZ68_9BACT|nr:Uncharacterized protein dnm_097290 [Desulfonema magnum]